MSTFPWDRLPNNELDRWIHQTEFNHGGLDLEIEKDGTLICQITGYDYYEIKPNQNLSDKNKSFLDSALKISGLFNLQYTLTDNKMNISGRTNTTFNNFGDKLKEFTTDRILVPDTNALLDKTLSNLIFKISEDFFKNLKIIIPRLVILELEKIANTEKNEKKRKVMYAYSELLLLKKNGAEFLPEISVELLNDFTSFSGNLTIDSWIRREIKNEAFKELTESNPSGYTLFTSDLVNALSANAENLPTLYVSKLPFSNDIPQPLRSQMIGFLILLSILFEEIQIKVNSKWFKIKGIWEGKTTEDWTENVITYSQYPVENQIKDVHENFSDSTSYKILNLLDYIKSKISTDEVSKYIEEKIEKINKISDEKDRMKKCIELKPYFNWFRSQFTI